MPKWAGTLVAVAALAVALIVGFFYSQTSADLWGQDRQPIAFSHQLHAGRLQINCLFCHRSAAQSPAATIPSLSLCMMCHQSLKDKNPEIEKLLTYWTDKKPIPWVRLQHLPGFVRFTHEMHLNAGFKCTECHGEVARMSQTPRAATYEMGWCLRCHERHRASKDCFTCHY
ncbi:MAG TPA: cytochrome c3 family protein [Candidatus Manganitrophaceae bacterium]|nr:cytochrome c3 family protein [Candidatus Manganitrophaceae bacterium]